MGVSVIFSVAVVLFLVVIYVISENSSMKPK